jgi:hypothetical protein
MASDGTRRTSIRTAICIDYNELITNAKFYTPEECMYTVGIQCCDRCYFNINEIPVSNNGTVEGMWACEYVANFKTANSETTRDYSIVLNFDICMDCYETIIGPMKYKLYINNPKIDCIKHDIVIKGKTSYYTCCVMPNAYYLCVYIIEEFAISDAELKECVDELQTKINKITLQNTSSPMVDITNDTDKMDTTQ